MAVPVDWRFLEGERGLEAEPPTEAEGEEASDWKLKSGEERAGELAEVG